MSLRGFGQTAFSLAHHQPGDADSKKVQRNQDQHEEDHGGGIGRRSKDGGEDGDDQQSVAKIPDEELGRNDAEERKKKDEDGQFKDQAEAEENEEDEVEIFVDVDERDDGALKADQEAQNVWQRDEISEGDAGEKQENRGEKKTGDGAALVFVKRGSDEKPDLIEDPGDAITIPR